MFVTWCWIWKIASDLDVELQKPREGDVRWEARDAIVRDAMFGY